MSLREVLEEMQESTKLSTQVEAMRKDIYVLGIFLLPKGWKRNLFLAAYISTLVIPLLNHILEEVEKDAREKAKGSHPSTKKKP